MSGRSEKYVLAIRCGSKKNKEWIENGADQERCRNARPMGMVFSSCKTR